MSDTNQNGLRTVDPSHNAAALILDNSSYNAMSHLAELMAKGKTSVPAHLRGNIADCMAVVLQAMQWQMNPFAVATKTFSVNGGPLSYESQLVNAVIIAKAPITARLNFEWFGPWERVVGHFREVVSRTKKDEDTGEYKKYRVPCWTLEDEQGIGVKVWATFRGEEHPRVLETLLVQARTRNSTLWADDPKQQLAYLAIKKWARLYCPDVIMGVYTPDEFDDPYEPREVDVTPAATTGSGSVQTGFAGESFGPKNSDEDTATVFRGLLDVAKRHDISAYEVAWKALHPRQRAGIGTECHERLKSIASTVDADFIDIAADPEPQAEDAEQ